MFHATTQSDNGATSEIKKTGKNMNLRKPQISRKEKMGSMPAQTLRLFRPSRVSGNFGNLSRRFPLCRCVKPSLAPWRETKYLVTSTMAYAIELILSRQLAECLAMPVFLTDTEGNLIFYNEPAEEILGKRYEDTGEMRVDEWGTVFKNKDDAGNPIPPEELPLVKTLINRLPYHKTFWIESLLGKAERISVTSYPIIGRAEIFLGAIAIFWRSPE